MPLTRVTRESKSSLLRSFTWREFLAVAIAVGAGLVGAVITSTNAKLSILSVLIGIAIALVITVITQVDRVGERISADFSRLEREILPVVRDLEHLPEAKDDLRQMLSAAATARQSHTAFIFKQIIRRIAEDRKAVNDICGGVFLCRNRLEELELLDSALATSDRSVRAVAALGLQAWIRPGWHEYFLRYVKHARENPQIKHVRVFLLTKDEAFDQRMLKIFEQLQNANIGTYAVDRDRISAELQRPIVLFDDALLMLHVNRDIGGGSVEVAFTDEPEKILDAVKIFESLLDLIHDFPSDYLLWPSDHGSAADDLSARAPSPI